VFEAEARRQSLLVVAQADDPNSDEAEVMRWIDAAGMRAVNAALSRFLGFA